MIPGLTLVDSCEVPTVPPFRVLEHFRLGQTPTGEISNIASLFHYAVAEKMAKQEDCSFEDALKRVDDYEEVEQLATMVDIWETDGRNEPIDLPTLLLDPTYSLTFSQIWQFYENEGLHRLLCGERGGYNLFPVLATHFLVHDSFARQNKEAGSQKAPSLILQPVVVGSRYNAVGYTEGRIISAEYMEKARLPSGIRLFTVRTC